MGMTLANIMTTGLKTITPDATISEAFELEQEFNVRHILVVDAVDGRLVGILSDRDLKKLASPFAKTGVATPQDNETLDRTVGTVMNRELIIGAPGDSVGSAVEVMLEKKVSSIPVVDPKNGMPVGIVTTDDLLRTLLKLL